MGNKDIKDYLHLYFKCWGVLDIGKHPHCTDYEDGKWALSCGILEYVLLNDSASFKPILRPLSDMTEEECKHLDWMFPVSDYNAATFLSGSLHSDEIPYLLKQGFDLFGLIKAGLAIDKTKIEHNGK